MRHKTSDDVLCTLAAVAVERPPGTPLARLALPQAESGDWATAVAADLARLVPEAAALDLVFASALYDPAELLRPHFPLHAALERYAARAPGPDGGRVIAFGAGPEGMVPDLAPDPGLADGPLKVLPFLLRGPADEVRRIGETLESRLLDTGMADAGTALATQAAFGLRCEHMRYLTLHDLMAMTAMQYEHAGLGALWPMVESALFGDGDEILLDAPPEPLVRYADGAVRIALLDADAWALGGFAPPGLDAEGMERAFARFEARQRQIAAVLAGHGLEVTFDHCPVGKDARAILRA